MGDREGQRDGISVELVDAADFLSRSSVPTEPDAPPARPGNMAPPPRPEAKRPTERAPDQPKTTTSSIENETPTASLPTLPGLVGKGSEAPEPKKKAKSAPQPEPPLQLSMPDMQFIPGGRGAAVTRPPGVTRSGENDEFGRGVIRALRQTMPSPTGALGRVTVRLLLSETGNLVNVQLVRGAEDPLLNQNVVFAAKQASFPIPPVNSTVADRTFLVTYVYR